MQFKTADLGFAAAIVTQGYFVAELDRSESNVMFVFDDDGLLEGISKDYFSGKLQVTALIYSNNIKMLKRSLYA